MTTLRGSRIALGATGGMVLVGIIVALSALQAPAVRATDEKTLREYAGVYRWGPDAFVYLQMWNEFSGFDKPGELVAFDESGEVRTLYPSGRDQFFAGPGMAISASIESRIEFQRDGAGRIASLTWRREGATPRVAQRVEIEKREDVRFASGNIHLSGTLTSPAAGTKHPAIILVHGSGAQNRESMLPWSRFLIRRGMAVLGYDKRGVGGSTGDWNTASFDDLGGDVVAAFEYLKTRSDIDDTQIGLLGVSQAGWIMPLAAVRSKDIAFLISISGAGVPPAETTLDQARNEMTMTGMPRETVDAIIGVLKLQYEFARTGRGWDDYAAAREKLAASLGKPPDTIPGTPDHPHWDVIRRSYFHDPVPILRQLRVPTLALWGELDNNILAEKNKAAWEAALKAGGNRDYTLRVLPKANHAQWEAKVGSNAEMKSLQRFVPAYFVTIQDWLAKRISGFGTPAPAQQASPEIARENVGRLQLAWTYRTGETDPRFATTKAPSFEATPIVVDGRMYLGTPLGRVIALDPATGQEHWVFDPQIARNIPYSDFANRGVSSWLDEAAPSAAPCRRRIFAATAQAQLIALDARDGKPCRDFGENGIVDLKAGLRIPPFEPQAYSITSPPVAVNGVVITGSSIGDNSRPDPASGEVRAYDARTGRLRWTWDPIPQDSRDPAYPEWRGALAHKGGGANAWSTLVADAERDLVFVPTGSAAPDYYGALRLGDNRYANSIVALRATTGQRVWAFQTVHHDLWDYDNASPPALVTLTRNGVSVAAVMQATKTGMLFVLERQTGRPVFPVEERPVPASDIPGEQAARTQVFTSLTPPLSPHRFTLDQVWGITAADRDACRAVIAPLRNDGVFTPPSTKGTLLMPARIGGANWGRVAVDPVRQLAVIAVNRIGEMVQLIPRQGFDLQRARSEEKTRLGDDFEYNLMQGTPFVMRRRLLLAPSRLPCTPPPFGALVAIDLVTGLMKWEVPLGTMTSVLSPELARQAKPDWGSVNMGGATATAGGVVFIGAALDRRLHAYDIETGRELWQGELPAGAKATPMTYRLESGTEYVAVAAGGGGAWGAGDYVVAFRVPSLQN